MFADGADQGAGRTTLPFEGSDTMYDEFIAGRNAVYEALEAGREIDCIYLQRSGAGKGLGRVVAAAKKRGVIIKDADAKKLDALCPGQNHQGVVAAASPVHYYTLQEVLQRAKQRGEAPFLVLCDGILDPHNLGAIIRTAECAGAHGVLMPKRRSAPISTTVYKSSAGACEHLPLCRVGNLVQTIEQLKEAGVWVYCADMDGVNFRDQDFGGPVAIVVGSEGEGVSWLVRQSCDGAVSLPLLGQISSLNASVAAGIVLYEVAGQRLAAKKGAQ